MKALEHDVPLKQDFRRLSPVQLARLGIEIVNQLDPVLKCITCGTTWSPASERSGRLPENYWHCPNKCNL